MRTLDPKRPKTRAYHGGVGTFPNKHGLIFVDLDSFSGGCRGKRIVIVVDTMHGTAAAECWYEVISGNVVEGRFSRYDRAKETYKQVDARRYR